MKPKVKYLSIYIRTRCFGGEEEGGWWYNHDDYVGSIRVKAKAWFSPNIDDYIVGVSSIIRSHRKMADEFIAYHTDNLYDDRIVPILEDHPKQEQTKGRPYYQ